MEYNVSASQTKAVIGLGNITTNREKDTRMISELMRLSDLELLLLVE